MKRCRRLLTGHAIDRSTDRQVQSDATARLIGVAGSHCIASRPLLLLLLLGRRDGNEVADNV